MNRKHTRLYDGGTTILIVIALLVGIGAASSGGSGFTLWNPTTWFSHKEASATDKALAAQEAAKKAELAAKEILLKRAQGEVHKTGEALTNPDQRGIEIATQTNANAVSALDQALGVNAAEVMAWRQLVRDLRSENAEVRAKAEKDQGIATQQIIAVSNQLAETRAKLEIKDAELAAKQADLRAAFDRENELANKARNMMFGGGVLLVVVIAVSVLWAINRFKVGQLGSSLDGLRSGIARGLRDADAESKEIGAKIRAILDTNVDRADQVEIKTKVEG